MERQSVTMKQRPETERPYEKCLKAGAESLTDGELLAVLIRCGTKNYSALELAFALLDRHPVYKGLAGLYHLDMEMLKTIPGIGKRVILARQSILRPIIWKRCGIFVLKR